MAENLPQSPVGERLIGALSDPTLASKELPTGRLRITMAMRDARREPDRC